MRRRTALLTAALLVVVVATGCGGSDSDDAPAEPEYGTFFGIAPQDTPNEADLARMVAGGIGSYHLSLTWAAIERQPGAYDWAAFDQLIEQLARAGLEPEPYVFGTPAEYADEPSEGPADEETLDAWSDFLGEAAKRYGPGGEFWAEFSESNPDVEPRPIHSWEIWNEPNSSLFWKPSPDPDAYAELLLRSAEALREVDPEAEVVSGGMFVTPGSPDSIRSYDFLEALYAIDGVGEAIDVVGVHPYSPRVKGDDGVIDQVERTRETIDDAGGEEAGLWITELGWGSDPDVPNDLAKTPEEQAELLTEAMGTLLDRRDELALRGIVWYTWRDFDVSISGCGWCVSAGLVDADRDGKPAWIALTELAGGEP